MDVGLLFSFRNPPQWRAPFPEFYAEQLRQVQLAEDLGFDTIWLTEHHFAEDGYSPSLFPLAAAIAARTTRVRIGTYLLVLPLHHPVDVGESAATIDVLSNGRFDLGVGLGYSPREFGGYGISLRERGSRMEEGIAILRGMMTEDPFSFEGKHYRLADVSLMPKAVQEPHIPLWVGASSRRGIERAARLGCHYLGYGVAAAQETYDAALLDNGRSPGDHHAAQLRWVHVASSRGQGWDDAQDHVHYMLSVYARWHAEAAEGSDDYGLTQVPPAAELRHTDQHMFGGPIIGTPNEVAAELTDMVKTIRTTHLVLGMHLPGLDPAKTRHSMELFAKEVLPALSA
jgi:alkanesulfonate monooxygenase SsuD/methylene tetrahydromethanopterin reductase-like flavin-dependent oxidoreductase (luciferase family)